MSKIEKEKESSQRNTCIYNRGRSEQEVQEKCGRSVGEVENKCRRITEK